jgi:dTDP-4-dehydrorhamnose 3,5-epimerase
MEVTHYKIKGLLSYVPASFKDERGVFFESYNHRLFEDMAGQSINFVQDNQSSSVRNTLRGLHFQAPPFAQGKLVRVISGSVIDVAVDLRNGSETYGQHVSVFLSAENNVVFWIPEGFAHGFSVLAENTIFAYKCTNYYNKASEQCLHWNDPDLAIDWKITDPLVSPKDQEGLKFSDFKSPF